MPAATDTAIVPGVSPQVYDQRDFERISQMIRREAGIVLGNNKRMLAYSRIAPLVRRSGRQTFKEYLDLIENDGAEQTRAIASLTTNHTYFNREPHHFDHFTRNVRPDLIAQAQRGDTVRIWSAGCSSGEEIYTLLMVLLGEDRNEGRQLSKRKIVALASDLAEHAVRAAADAVYPAEALSKLPPALRENWCVPAPDAEAASLGISPDIKQMVRFRQLNLLRPWPFGSLFDLIFCRNVMIYFDGPTKEQLVLNFARQLKPGAHLYIGHSERVSGPATELLEPVGTTIYRRKAA